MADTGHPEWPVSAKRRHTPDRCTTAMTTTTPTLRVRRLRPDDTHVLDTVFAGLSAQSRYLRFHSPVPRLSGPLRRMLLNVDDHDRLALVAEARTSQGWEPIGIARLIRTAPGQAEIAVAVIDAWHRRGIGRTLLTAVQVAATARGLDRLTALVLAENEAAQALIHSVFPLCTTRRDGATVLMTCHMHPDTITLDDLVA
jgi:GNAT superfamily N-acetyltransferase